MNVEVPNSSGFRYVNESNKCSLVIADSFPEGYLTNISFYMLCMFVSDGGEYKCAISNEYGSDEHVINLTVSVDTTSRTLVVPSFR